jgi:hypothetical protein
VFGRNGEQTDTFVKNIQYPMSNIECPSGAGVWRQHVSLDLAAFLANQA